MTVQEFIESYRADCNFAAQDCKNAADYAAYNFGKDRDDEAIQYAEKVMEHAKKLASCVDSLKRFKAKHETVSQP